MSEFAVPFNKVIPQGRELEYLETAIRNGHISGDGPFTKKCQALIEEALDVHKALLTTSCTHALEMAAILLDIQEGDEVIAPSYTFVSTINAFILRGAKPVFAEIRADTLNIDETKLDNLITRKTKAIVVVHYAGVACEMDDILTIAERFNVPVIEDNAHGNFGRYNGKFLGTFGKMATLSFHETKNISCGEGGCLLINDAQFEKRAEIIREKGTDRSAFFQGKVDKYSWRDIGSSYVPSDMLAAFLYGQLEVWRSIQEKRKVLWGSYNNMLSDWAERSGVGTPQVPDHCENACHMYYLILPTSEQRDLLITYLAQRKIMSVFHYLPLHVSEVGQKYGYKEGDYPITESMSSRLIRLPFFNEMSLQEQERVSEAVKNFKC